MRQVSVELIRVAILWHEMWHEALEEASRLYFGDHNIEGMLAVLAPLHAMLESAGGHATRPLCQPVFTHSHVLPGRAGAPARHAQGRRWAGLLRPNGRAPIMGRGSQDRSRCKERQALKPFFCILYLRQELVSVAPRQLSD
jgi:hypothetical protein